MDSASKLRSTAMLTHKFPFLFHRVLRQGELLSVEGATATSECLAKCAASTHDADSLIEIAEAEMDCVERAGSGSFAEASQTTRDTSRTRHRPERFGTGVS